MKRRGVLIPATTCVNPESILMGGISQTWSSPCGLRTRHSVCEDVGFIPGLTEWVRDLVLPQVGA